MDVAGPVMATMRAWPASARACRLVGDASSIAPAPSTTPERCRHGGSLISTSDDLFDHWPRSCRLPRGQLRNISNAGGAGKGLPWSYRGRGDSRVEDDVALVVFTLMSTANFVPEARAARAGSRRELSSSRGCAFHRGDGIGADARCYCGGLAWSRGLPVPMPRRRCRPRASSRRSR